MEERLRPNKLNLPEIETSSDLFGPARRGSEVRSNPLPQYLIWRQDRRGAPLQIYTIYSKSWHIFGGDVER